MTFDTGTERAVERPTPTTRFGRLVRFCLDQLSGMRISFGSGGHEQKLTLTFSFLSSLVASVILLTVLWAGGAAWFVGGSRYALFWGQLSGLQDNLFVYMVHVIVATALTIGAWIVDVVEAVGAALLVFLAAASIGAIVGFLFGVPRPLSESGPGAASAAAAASSNPTRSGGSGDGTMAAPTQVAASSPVSAASPGWYANTNLTQVSDWLTKIIVGVGLVEAGRTADAAKYVIHYVKPAVFGGGFGAVLVMPALMIVGLIIGFMYCYLFTQLFLAALMAQTADAISHNIDLFEAKPTASSKLIAIEPGDFILSPPLKIPNSAAPVRAAPTPTPEEIEAAAQMQSIHLSDINDPASLIVWARAGAVLNQYVRAAAGYRKLLAIKKTPEILVEAARIFSWATDFQGARQLIDEAFEHRDSAAPGARARIAFDVAHLALYDPKPAGYRRALDAIENDRLLDRDKGGRLHVLHAWALAQQCAYETTLTADEKAKLRQAILADLRIANADPVNRPWILYLLGRDPDGQLRPIRPGPNEDDDLFPFKNDPDFLALLGLSTPGRGLGPTGPTGSSGPTGTTGPV